MNQITPHTLIEDSYPIAQRCISSLVEIAKANSNLIQEVIELSIVIGINAAMSRIDWDKKMEIAETIKKEILPRW